MRPRYYFSQVEVIEPPVTGLLILVAIGIALGLIALLFWWRD